MDWNTLLNQSRPSSLSDTPAPSEDHRGGYKRDWDRLVFSTAFRRLNDKTQVFPLPDNDVIHSRLTHSLEVASVGRSLGERASALINHAELPHYEAGDVVAAACLAHDIGNPPFGHAGEDAIRRYFAKNMPPDLTERQTGDLSQYEGNAQGFRILSRLQFEDYGGMRLTAATLGTFIKYPRESGTDFAPSQTEAKKIGVFQTEVHLLESLATQLGMPRYSTDGGSRGWRRHPLAYLVEAADDICNAVLDLEDGCRLGLVKHNDVDQILRAIIDGANSNFRDKTLDMHRDPRDRTGYLRACAIGVLVEECAAAFSTRASDILEGKTCWPLITLCTKAEQAKELGRLAAQTCYNAPAVLERESAGYSAIVGLLERFVPVALEDSPPKGSLESRLLSFLEQRTQIKRETTQNHYDRIIRVLDYLSGMTDSYAIECYRRFCGIRT